jgi:hypothetical protein
MKLVDQRIDLVRQVGAVGPVGEDSKTMSNRPDEQPSARASIAFSVSPPTCTTSRRRPRLLGDPVQIARRSTAGTTGRR